MELKVCVGSACHLKGSSEVVKTFQMLISQHRLFDSLELKGSFCMGRCDEEEITVEFDGKVYKTSPEKATRFFNEVILPVFTVDKTE